MTSGRGNHSADSKSSHIYNCFDMSFLTKFEKKSLKKVKNSLKNEQKSHADLVSASKMRP